MASREIAFFEIPMQVPANRIGYHGPFTLTPLKITQEAITLPVFVPCHDRYLLPRLTSPPH